WGAPRCEARSRPPAPVCAGAGSSDARPAGRVRKRSSTRPGPPYAIVGKLRRELSGRDAVYNDVDQAVTTHEVRDFAEGIAARGHRVARARNPCNHLYLLPRGERAAGNHGV